MEGPIIPYPVGINEDLARLFYDFVLGENDDIYNFDESDPVCNLWLSYATEHGRYPRLEDVKFVVNGPTLYLFADGAVISEYGGDVAYL